MSWLREGISNFFQAGGGLPPPPSPSDAPTAKERLAYTIEWSIKIVYPLAFVVFNIAYWSYYLKNYRAEADV